MPPIRFLGHTVQRMSTALNEARYWRPFHVRLCPALAGIELLKDGGYCTLELDPEARQPGPLPLPPPPPPIIPATNAFPASRLGPIVRECDFTVALN